MNRGLYISATLLIANQKKLEALSNNLANANTTGFKKDMALMETFPEKLLSKINDGKIQPRASTQNGYFVVSTAMGNSYVKDISFTIDDQGYLKTYYQGGGENLKTDYENYITDGRGNRLRGQSNMEALPQGQVYNPPNHVVGTIGPGVKFQKMVTDFSQGDPMETGGKYDLALTNSGFFKVTGEDGNNYYTRDGSFIVDRQGRLMTLNGELVQGTNGTINIIGEDVSIDINGRITADGRLVGTLDIVDIENREFLRKIGDNLYSMVEGEQAQEIPYGGEVLQGYLESSNVQVVDEMVKMITAQRAYEINSKTIQTSDEMLQLANNLKR